MKTLGNFMENILKLIIIFVAFSVGIIMSCKPEVSVTTTPTNITMTYNTVQCESPWDNAKEAAVKTILEAKGIQVVNITVTNACVGIVVCQACGCNGCELITVTIPATDEAKMAALNFKRQ